MLNLMSSSIQPVIYVNDTRCNTEHVFLQLTILANFWLKGCHIRSLCALHMCEAFCLVHCFQIS